MKNKFIGLLLAPVLIFGGAVGAVVNTDTAYAATPPTAEFLAQARATILNDTNNVRAENGLPPVKVNPTLDVTAQNWSQHQAELGLMEHNPNMSAQSPAGWRWLAENVAAGQKVSTVVAAWKKSSGHFANLTNINATDIGIGVYESDSGALYFTQNFGGYDSTKTVPSQVNINSVQPVANTGISVNFTTPAFTVSSEPTGYEIKAEADGYPTVTKNVATDGDHTVTGLTAGANYTMFVRATNSSGAGAWSKPSTPIQLKGVPTVFVDSISSTSHEATINWSVNANGEPVQKVVVTLNSKADATKDPAATNHTFTALKPGTNYSGTVTATNSLGSSIAVPFTFTTDTTVPGQPKVTATIVDDSGLRLDWVESSEETGTPLTGWYAQIFDMGGNIEFSQQISADQNHLIMYGLKRGQTYNYFVTAINNRGETISEVNNITIPYTAPTAVLDTKAELVDERTITVNWVAPTDDGGTPLTGYSVNVYRNGAFHKNVPLGMVTTVTFDADTIDADSVYSFSVQAMNKEQTGAQNFSNQIVVPKTPTKPDEVKTVTVTPTHNTLTFVWDEPINNGGAVITGYEVEITDKATGQKTKNVVNVDGSSENKTVFSNLTRVTKYDYSIVAVNKKGNSTPKEGSTETTANLPGDVENIVSVMTKVDEVNIAWNAVDNGGDSNLSYDVTITDADGNVVKTVNVKTTDIMLSSVKYDTYYLVTVNAKNSAGASNKKTIQFETAKTASPVNNVNVNATKDDVTVNWEPATSNGTLPLSGYQISVHELTTGTIYTQVVAPNVNTLKLDVNNISVFSGRTHEVTVAALTGAGVLGKTDAPTTFVVPANAPTVPLNAALKLNTNGVNTKWSTPTYDGGAPITGYVVALFDNATKNVVETKNVGDTTHEVNFDNLNPVTTYYSTVKAVNEAGESAAAVTGTVKTNAVAPTAPVNLKATPTVSKTMELAWDAPLNDGGASVTHYSYSVINNATGTPAVTSTKVTGTSYVFTGEYGVEYTLEVTATNGAGSSVAGTKVFTVPAAAPNKIGDITVKNAGATEAELVWDAPEANGAPITDYILKWNVEGTNRQLVTATNTAKVKGLLPNSETDVTVIAVNSAGDSEPKTVTVKTVWDAPTAVLNSSIVFLNKTTVGKISWDAPTVHPNVAGMLTYDVTVYSNDKYVTSMNTNTTSVLTPSVANGAKVYATIKVSAGNVEGETVTTETVTAPIIAPTKPTNLEVRLDDKNNIAVTWGAPTFDGGQKPNYVATLWGSNDEVIDRVSTSDSVANFADLTPNKKYSVTVAAFNSAGSSGLVKETFNTSTVVADKVKNFKFTGTVNSFREGNLTWDATANTGGADTVTYVLTIIRSDGEPNKVVELNSTSYDLVNLVHGVKYTFNVVTKNVAGLSAAATTSYDVPTVAPNILTLEGVTVAADNNIEVRWVDGYDGGTPITGYIVQLLNGNKIVETKHIPANTHHAVFSNETNNFEPNTLHTMKIVAVNKSGSSIPVVGTVMSNIILPAAAQPDTLIVDKTDLTVKFTSAKHFGGDSTVTYDVVLFTADGVKVTENFDVQNNETVFGGLIRGQKYYAKIVTTNSVGSVETKTNTVTIPAVAPDAVSNVTVNVAAENAVTIKWDAPTYDGGASVKGYVVKIVDSNDTEISEVNVTSNSYVIPAGMLQPVTGYVVKVAAVNDAGTSPLVDTPFVTKVMKPANVTDIKLTANGSTVTGEFTPTANMGGDTTVIYNVKLVDSKGQMVAEQLNVSSPFVFDNLTAGAVYYVTVSTTNSAGTVTVNSTEVTVPAVVADAPTNVKVTLNGEQSLKVVWDAPTYDGGASVTSYVVTYVNKTSNTTNSVLVNGNSVILDNLDRDSEYVITVGAVNTAGTSVAADGDIALMTAPNTVITPMSEDTLAGVVKNGVPLTSTFDGNVITIDVRGVNDNVWLAGFAYSAPKSLGWAFTSNEKVSFNVAGLPAGDHTVALHTADGAFYGFALFNVAATPTDTETPVTVAPVTPDASVNGGVPVVDTKTVKPFAVDGTKRKLPYTGGSLINLLLVAGAGALLLGAGVFTLRRKEVKKVI